MIFIDFTKSLRLYLAFYFLFFFISLAFSGVLGTAILSVDRECYPLLLGQPSVGYISEEN